MEFKICAATLMRRDATIISYQSSIFEATSRLIRERSSLGFVVDDEDNLLGIFSEYDGLKPFLKDVYFETPDGLVSDVMSLDVKTIKLSDDIITMAEKFLASSYKTLPVVRKAKVLGTIDRWQILEALNKKNMDNNSRLRHTQKLIIGLWR